ncbi:MAG: AAA family ATPase [Scytonematopsis contorta HA4267-MV1]|jgi:tetratricopeptide (TPR) repeat protein|nr:AAA family ATPase [Scytonematopsis contorta HA4267-MV1]
MSNFQSLNEEALAELIWTLEASVGEFKLILARCNYLRLRSHIVKKLQENTNLDIQFVNLKKTDKTLYAKIYSELAEKQPKALMVFYLESLRELTQMLSATNQVREEFRKNFHFPLVIWVTDEVFQQMLRFASDFESWATTVKFTLPNNELIQSLQQDTDTIFATSLSSDTYSLGWQMGYLRRREIATALKDLQQRGEKIEPSLKASVEFVCGQDAYLKNQIDKALLHYHKSLEFWQNYPSPPDHFPLPTPHSLLRAGVLQFYIGLCYLQQAERYRGQSRDYLEIGRTYLQECINLFTQENRLNLVAKFINPLGEVLQRLEDWKDLEHLAKKSLNLQQIYGNHMRTAQAYGFLAEVSLSQLHWTQAKQNAQKALYNIAKAPLNQQQHRPLYFLLLAQAEQNLGQVQRSVTYLQQAQSLDTQDNPRQYIRILNALQKIFWQQKLYLEAFRAKQQQRSIEQQYGFRAFIGAGSIKPQRQAKLPLTQIVETLPINSLQKTIAPEMTASGRGRDVENLLDRIARPDYKLIVIHGYSGVGKSSLVQAGVIPALKNRVIGTQDFLPVTTRIYTNWLEELERQIMEALREHEQERPIRTPIRIDAINRVSTHSLILEKLRLIEASQLRTVLIFDQFEEFIFVYKSPAQRREFFEFLGECLNILGMKVILSLRQDYLHYLLECNSLSNMKIINNDILSKNVLYQLDNFAPSDAKSLVESLTAYSNFNLEPFLINQLVEDLAIKFGEVRPIELQVVGAQLQTENITDLVTYQQRGPKEELVKRYLKEVVEDCGAENKHISELTLYSLTDEKGTRPLKTRSELERDLQVLTVDSPLEINKLDLILQIFVESGIVVLVPDNPENCYQLVHDYLAAFIQKQQKPKFNELIAKLTKERNQLRLSENKLNHIYKWGMYAAVLVASGLAILLITTISPLSK